VTFSVRADANTDDLVLSCGSIAAIVLGNHTPQVRGKAADLGAEYDDVTLSHTGSGLYESLFAVRRTPDRSTIATDFDEFVINEITDANADAQILAIAVDPSKTDATGFDTPIEHNNVNSAIEITENVTTFPDQDGNVVTDTANPGGFQLGLANIFNEGTGTNQRSSSTQRVRKRKLQNGDILVVLGITNSAIDYTVTFDTEQDF
jgi:hypothetical protein